ncbi:RNA-directed DNA polymerase [Clostridium tagluense]|uniref:RNA-directed DNA polymerase n=1 Tax=Clostridium tagluense TaxID=360422 RepID=UPI001CF4EE53|nr:RNA-directed DNA polymerase [Clostridium tagluense]MCB2300276.1 RNA-directed DNA polymerase [Clostridium tagluense]
MFKFENLIRNEYFPAELPPCFSTKVVFENYDKIKNWTSGVKRNQSIPLTYNGFKNENSRRKFAIPNIYHYFKAVNCIVENSTSILNVTNQSKMSLTKPLTGTPPDDQPYNKKTYSITMTKKIVEKLYQDNLFQIKLDISSFFDSIYTHTIPWAMHSKAIAKKSRGKSLVGDKLDICIREMNYGQTNGILVGNAVSRIISEIILCTVDKEIQEQFKNVKCCRFVDDYYIFVKDTFQIQNIISFIRNELGKYELMLNENKSQIIESPFIYGKHWVEEIKLFIHLNSEVFLNKVISLYTEYKDISILRYGLTVLSLHNINKNEWDVMESKILNLWVKFPSISDLIIKILIAKNESLKKGNLKNAMYSILDRCIPINHHQEIIWAVWFAKVFDIQIKKDYIVKIIESQNSMAIIILLHIIYSKNYNMSKEVKKSILDLRENLKTADLDENEEDGKKKSGNLMWTQNWLIAYEADLNEWFNIESEKFEFAREDLFFKNLIKSKIRFYDTNFHYSEVTGVKKSIQYVTKSEFLSYVKKINKLLSEISDLKENGKDIIEIQKTSKDILDRIEAQSETY